MLKHTTPSAVGKALFIWLKDLLFLTSLRIFDIFATVQSYYRKDITSVLLLFPE